MDFRDVMVALEALGTAQNRKVYRRHGAGPDLFGVSFANLKKLRKRIGRDHEMAEKLWASGNADARVLATMVAEPLCATRKQLEAWVREIDYYVVGDAFANNLASHSRHARVLTEKWLRSREEWTASTGWTMLAIAAMKDREQADSYFEAFLPRIEASISRAKNRVRYAMNNALIAIGIRTETLAREAIAVAGRMGPVQVDHGETGCQTPDAVAYINKARDRVHHARPRRRVSSRQAQKQ